MDFRELSYICAIAHAGSISGAAEELHIAQPSLSRFLQQTEALYGLALFHRVNGRYLPTDAGRLYLEEAREILERKEILNARLARLKDPDSGSLRIGFSPTRAATLLPRILPAFRKMYPHVDLRLREAIADELEEELNKGELDLFFCDLERRRSPFSYQILRREEILLILAAGHPAVSQALPMPDGGFSRLPLELLSGETFLLLTELHRLGRHSRSALRRHLPADIKTLTLGNLRAAAELVYQGYGASFLYDSLIPALGFENRLAAFCFEPQRLTTSYAAVSLKSAPPPPCAAAFVDLVRQALG